MKLLLHLITIALCVGVAYTCTAEGQWDVSCNKDKPFCVDTSHPSSMKQLECVACRPGSNCDCPLDQYCSSSRYAGTVGQCKKFSKSGKTCLPMSYANYLNPNVSSDLKCVDTTSGPNSATLYADFLGVCIEKTCRVCTPLNGVYCTSSYIGPSRVCIFPGEFETLHSASWAPGQYYESPVAVWCAIIFVLVVFILLITAANFVKEYRGGGYSRIN